jgi:DNA primase
MRETKILEAQLTNSTPPQTPTHGQPTSNYGIGKRENAQQYYHRIRDIEITRVVDELIPDRVVERKPGLILCDCPRHASTSKRSLHINTVNQLWYCFGCGVGGDILQLVEFIQSGEVTSSRDVMPPTHRAARDWLGAQIGIPPLSGYGLSRSDVDTVEGNDGAAQRTLLCLTEIATHYHEQLMNRLDVIEWFRNQYGLSDSIIIGQRIGYAHNVPGTFASGQKYESLLSRLVSQSFSHDEILSTGIFTPSDSGDPQPFFRNRITFPYWFGGRAAYMIGRRTPWTGNETWERAKYKKAQTHDEHTRRHVSPAIANQYLHNESVLLRRPETVVITEGITDNLSGMDHGLPCVSPVTTTIRRLDWQRLMPRLSSVKTVYVVGDNEISRVGLETSLRTASELTKHGIDARVVVLPLTDEQRSTRQQLLTQFGVGDHLNSKQIAEIARNLPDTEIDHYHSLVDAAKCDLNEYFRLGGTAEDFERLQRNAPTPMEFAVDHIPVDASHDDIENELQPILEHAANLDAFGQKRIIDRVIRRFKSWTRADLKDQLRSISTRNGKSVRSKKRLRQWTIDAEPGTCKHAIQTVIAEIGQREDSIEIIYSGAAEAAFRWLLENGCKFYATKLGKPYFLYENTIYRPIERRRGHEYRSLIYRLTGLTTASPHGRVFYEVLLNLASENGEVQDAFSWLHTDTTECVVYWSLNNERNEIARISPDGVEIIPNGGNEYDVYLLPSDKIRPIEYTPDFDGDHVGELINQLILKPMACNDSDRLLIWLWFSSFLLMEFSGSRPMTRFEGPSGQGKTTAAKILSTLLYGEECQKQSTLAADRADSQKSPILFLDNIETKQMSPDRINFFLITVTGIRNEKRAMGTDSDTVLEEPKCLINMTGIEPLSAEYSEITSRAFLVRFSKLFFSKQVFLDIDVLNGIRQHRNIILSYLMQQTSQVLAFLKDGKQRSAMALIQQTFGAHLHDRNNAYLALMYLMLLVDCNSGERRVFWKQLHPEFSRMITDINRRLFVLAKEANSVSMALGLLFKLYRQRVAGGGPYDIDVHEFESRYAVKFLNEYELKDMTAQELSVTLGKVSRDYFIEWPFRKPGQLTSRIENDMAVIEACGFAIQTIQGESRTYYRITRTEEQ